MLTPYNSKAIINNINLIFKTGDITKLNTPTYHFVYLLSGFIANYNLQGFQSAYSDLRLFANDLLKGCDTEAEHRSTEKWAIQQYGQEYCQSKALAIKGIREVVEKYRGQVNQSAEKSDIEKLTGLRDVINEVLRRNDPQITQILVRRLELR